MEWLDFETNHSDVRDKKVIHTICQEDIVWETQSLIVKNN